MEEPRGGAHLSTISHSPSTVSPDEHNQTDILTPDFKPYSRLPVRTLRSEQWLSGACNPIQWRNRRRFSRRSLRLTATTDGLKPVSFKERNRSTPGRETCQEKTPKLFLRSDLTRRHSGNGTQSTSFRRNISNACVVVTSLKVSRSKLLNCFSTIVSSAEANPMNTVPTGLASLPPPGPATPVTERA